MTCRSLQGDAKLWTLVQAGRGYGAQQDMLWFIPESVLTYRILKEKLWFMF